MIQLDYRDGRPIYEQVKDGFKKLILSGALKEGEKLPSVRELSTLLAVNPNTIQRAYRELEVLGYTYSAAGKGSFVAATSATADLHRQELLERFDALVAEWDALGFDRQGLRDRLEEGGRR